MNWYVIRTHPHSENSAAWELNRAGFETFFPRVKSAPTEDRYTPLFPGYLFLHCDLQKEGRPSLESAPHVSGWLSFDGVTPSVSNEEVAQLAQRVEALNNDGGVWRRFKPGEKVWVECQSVQSLAEVVEEPRSPQSRVKVLMEFMGRLVSAQVPWQDLQPVNAEAEDSRLRPRRTRGRGRWIRGFGPQLATQ